MKLTLHIPDDLYETLKRQSDSKDDAGARAELKDRLARFINCPRTDRALLVDPASRRAIEKILQTTLETPAQLVAAMTKMAGYSIGGLDFTFTPDELIRLNTQAQFHGWTSEDYLKATVGEIVDRVMDRI